MAENTTITEIGTRGLTLSWHVNSQTRQILQGWMGVWSRSQGGHLQEVLMVGSKAQFLNTGWVNIIVDWSFVTFTVKKNLTYSIYKMGPLSSKVFRLIRVVKNKQIFSVALKCKFDLTGCDFHTIAVLITEEFLPISQHFIWFCVATEINTDTQLFWRFN